jgi:hypothetical protein
MKKLSISTRIGIGMVAGAAMLAATMTATPAKADAVADFYKGRDVTFIVGFSVGGSYGAYSRLLARHMAQYIPGKPNILSKHRKGGGGSRAANYLYNVAPKDGTMLGVLGDSLALAQLMFPKKAKYDARNMRYIGRLTPVNPVLVINKNHKVKWSFLAPDVLPRATCSPRPLWNCWAISSRWFAAMRVLPHRVWHNRVAILMPSPAPGSAGKFANLTKSKTAI